MKRGFSLVEMLVVMGIIAVLIGASIAGYSAMTRTAERARDQELVSNVATALTEYYNRNGSWPKSLVTAAAKGEKSILDATAAYPLAKDAGGSLSLLVKNKKLAGVDRLGIVDIWASKVIRQRGSGASSGDAVPSGGTIEDHTLHFALDLDGDGFIKDAEAANVGGKMVKLRATAAVWSCGKDGKIDPYPYGDGGSGSKGSNKGSSGGKTDDVYSWTKGQTRNID